MEIRCLAVYQWVLNHLFFIEWVGELTVVPQERSLVGLCRNQFRILFLHQIKGQTFCYCDRDFSLPVLSKSIEIRYRKNIRFV